MSVSKPPSIAVCILNWNGKSLLEQYLPSVIAHSQYPNTQLVMIDNASTDDSISFVQKNYPQITLVCNTQNLGFVGGYNVGLKHVSADYYVLLNSDVAVTANWIAPIVELMTNDPTIFAVQPKIRSDLQPTYFEYAGAAGGCIDRLGYIFCRGRFFDVCEIDNGQYNTNTEVFWASGAAMFVRADAFWALGGLDTDFFAHMEEIDLCWRAKQAGYKIMVCPQSVVYHLGGGSLPYGSPRKLYYNFRNNLVMLCKNLRTFELFILLPLRLLLDVVAALKSVIGGKKADALVILRANWDFVLHLPKWLQKRKTAQQLIAQNKLHNSSFAPTGRYNGSIIVDYFLLKKTKSPF